ncbi:hypothetical protein FB45DRAFT_1033015 [Roridomyces roridus]|uniref:Uncharacterized protein n=1 Tax=Roridomyces roridus TaxID=1738132 RepID=A0AAD7BGD5_9AGAR|nr:hypothetical protein FB45DRAFT_1033015 [Roridomyces roridus]
MVDLNSKKSLVQEWISRPVSPEETAASEKPKRRKKKADSATEAPAQKKATPKRDDKLRFVEAAIERYLLSNKPKDVNGRICDVSDDQVIDGERAQKTCANRSPWKILTGTIQKAIIISGKEVDMWLWKSNEGIEL